LRGAVDPQLATEALGDGIQPILIDRGAASQKPFTALTCIRTARLSRREDEVLARPTGSDESVSGSLRDGAMALTCGILDDFAAESCEI
jgi:hypothetical protein